MIKVSLFFMAFIMLMSCSDEPQISQILPIVDQVRAKHEAATSNFSHELELFVAQSKKEQELAMLMLQGNMTESDKKKMKEVIGEGENQMASMVKASNAVVESTTSIMSLMSAIYGLCGHNDIRDKTSSFISQLQVKYDGKIDVDTKFWNSVWTYEEQFKNLDIEYECSEFTKVKSGMDSIINDTMSKMSETGA